MDDIKLILTGPTIILRIGSLSTPVVGGAFSSAFSSAFDI